MRIAVLMTNTDESAFSQAWPKDGEKFPAMMLKVRPDWEFEVFDVKDGVFPDSLEGLDGVMITGSPHSVNSGEAWVERLFGLIREIYAKGLPMFGACFGHQAIAKALGGEVGDNPEGWVFGLVEAKYRDGTSLPLYASHSEQVIKLPDNAEIIAEGPDCGVAGFVIGQGVMTNQYHPEMEPEFIAALVEHLADELPADVIDAARESLVGQADMVAMAERIALFLEKS
ncbi:type 1 glutamine amidotransferase [Lentibacter algarum]|uniref:type 1 glutamine amidotransferase n=1 Tax=Lentibacter algarum TaxID=576131 RepID=UPI001C08635E|nr:type 1 glutamine amidotransferase [Lentibacter algarum]MBU2983193.1 type 1 glutamine amidotransferase [Lentibacter algarum]